MPKPVSYDLSRIDARIIVYSDRIHAGTKEDRATPACSQALERAGVGSVSSNVVPESRDTLEAQVREAIGSGARFVLVLGGSGFGVGNEAPEVVREVIEVEIPGIAEQIRSHGLAHTPLWSPRRGRAVGRWTRSRSSLPCWARSSTSWTRRARSRQPQLPPLRPAIATPAPARAVSAAPRRTYHHELAAKEPATPEPVTVEAVSSSAPVASKW